jgi:hypothetical protein
MGMHNSRKLQLEQATLMAWGFMVYLGLCVGLALDQGLSLNRKIFQNRVTTCSVQKILKNKYGV